MGKNVMAMECQGIDGEDRSGGGLITPGMTG